MEREKSLTHRLGDGNMGRGGSRLKSLFLCQECAGQREDAVTFL